MVHSSLNILCHSCHLKFNVLLHYGAGADVSLEELDFEDYSRRVHTPTLSQGCESDLPPLVAFDDPMSEIEDND